MKQKLFLVLLLTPTMLVACNTKIDNTNLENFGNPTNDSGNIVENQFQTSPIHEERLSYQEYVEKYEEVPNSQNEDQGDNHLQEEKYLEDSNSSNNSQGNLLASYSTPLQSSSDERINNIDIVCERLNGFILKPNETFSYNEVTGPFGPSDGFEEAPILLSDGTKTDGYGGGVCQLSSTLYNVVKNINNVNITERHHHSAPVSYVPKGEDATVSLQSNLDFKFVNNTNYAIQFKANCDDKNVTVWAYRVI